MNTPCSRCTRILAATLALLGLALPSAGQAPPKEKESVEEMVRRWEKEVRQRLEKNEKLKPLATKHPLVVLHSRKLYAEGAYLRSAYSFIYETSNPKDHRNDVQLLFHNGGTPKTFVFNMVVNQQNLVVDLGPADFAKDPDPSQITIDHAGLATGPVAAVEGNVYLERVRDGRGNNFYVLFQVVAVDPDSRYLAFVWRKLPGGKVVRQQILQ